MNSIFEKTTDFDKEIANFLLEIPNLITSDNEAPMWSSKRRRTHRVIVPQPLKFSPAVAADGGGDSEFETPSCSESEGEKLVTDDNHRIDEENHCEIKDGETSGLEPSKTNVRRIKFKSPKPPDSPAINNGDEHSLSVKEDVDLDVIPVESKKNTFHESGKGKLAEGEGGLVGLHQEMRKKVVLLEQHKDSILEAIEKVKDYLKKQKALNLQLKAQKLQLSSIKAKSDSG